MTEVAPIPRLALTREEAATRSGCASTASSATSSRRSGWCGSAGCGSCPSRARAVAGRECRADRMTAAVRCEQVGRRGANRPARGPRRQERHEQANGSRDQGSRPRHARSCRTATAALHLHPDLQGPGLGRQAGKRITRTFPTITAARQWREDAHAALRAGTLTADRGPTLQEAADDWLAAARAGIVRNRSGDPYKPFSDPRLRAEPPQAGAARARARAAAGDHAAAAAAVRRPARRGRPRRRDDHHHYHAAQGDLPPRPPARRGADQPGIAGSRVPSVNRRQERFATVEQVEAMLASSTARRTARCGRPPSTPACAAAS